MGSALRIGDLQSSSLVTLKPTLKPPTGYEDFAVQDNSRDVIALVWQRCTALCFWIVHFEHMPMRRQTAGYVDLAIKHRRDPSAAFCRH